MSAMSVSDRFAVQLLQQAVPLRQDKKQISSPKITGIHHQDDMGIYLRHLDNGKAIYRLIVSERALDLFRKHGLRHGEVDVAPVA